MATPAKKTAAPAKKAEPAKATTPPRNPPPKTAEPEKKAPAKAEAKKADPQLEPESEKEPVFDGVAEDAPAPPEEVKAEKKTAKDTLDAVAADRGWVQSPPSENFDVVYTKSNPVLGGYEHLRVSFKGGGVNDVEHENLNRAIPFPEDGSKIDNAISVLTGENWPSTS